MSLWKIQWTQSIAFSELYSNQPKSEIYPKMPVFEQLKKQIPVNSNQFWPLIKKILIWTFWDYKSSWSKKSTSILPSNRSPPTMYFQKTQFLGVFRTLAKTEIIYPKNVGALVAMDFTSDKYSAPRTIEKMKILGALLELPALPIQPIYLKIGPNWPNRQCFWAVSSKRAPRFWFFQLPWMPMIHFMWNSLPLMPLHFLGILFQS